MSNVGLLPSLLFNINQNQLALEAAIMELTLWVEQRGSGGEPKTFQERAEHWESMAVSSG